MNSARGPEQGSTGTAAAGASAHARPFAGFDTGPGGLLPDLSAPQAWPSHLEACSRCGALNGRSATACWACEAALNEPAVAASVAPPSSASPEPVAPVLLNEQTVVERPSTLDGRIGLHLVSRGDEPTSVQASPEPAETMGGPSFEPPVLTAQLDDRLALPPELAGRPAIRYPSESAPRRASSSPSWPMVTLVAVLLIGAAAALQWGATGLNSWGGRAAATGSPPSPPVAAVDPPVEPPTAAAAAPVPAGSLASIGGEAADVLAATPAPGPRPALETDSRPALETGSAPVAETGRAGAGAGVQAPPPLDSPGDVAAANPPVIAPERTSDNAPPARVSGRGRDSRRPAVPVISERWPADPARQRSPAPARCTSNMAALGLCTLAPASTKE